MGKKPGAMGFLLGRPRDTGAIKHTGPALTYALMGLNGPKSQSIWTLPTSTGPAMDFPEFSLPSPKQLFLWDLVAPQLPTRTKSAVAGLLQVRAGHYPGQGRGREGAGGGTNQVKQDSPDSSSLTVAQFADSCHSRLTGPEAASLPPRAVETRGGGTADDNCGHPPPSPHPGSDRALSRHVSLVLPNAQLPVRVLSPFHRWGHLDILN